MFQYVAQKVDTVVYTLKLCFLKIAQKVTTYLGYVLLNLITKNFKIIAQSGHTDSVVTFNLSLFFSRLPTYTRPIINAFTSVYPSQAHHWKAHNIIIQSFKIAKTDLHTTDLLACYLTIH